MKRVFTVALMAIVLSMPLVADKAEAGAKIKINDNASIDLGFRLQSLYLSTDSDLDDDGDFEKLDDFLVRRARFRLGGKVNDDVSIFLQTDFSQGAGSGGDVRLIDAFLKYAPSKAVSFIIGENMAPVTRQNLTSSGGLMAVDRPGITYKNLTWGTRALSTFSTKTYSDSDTGLRGDVDVRDLGITLFGSTSYSDSLHLKYYLGVYDGIQKADTDSERFAARVQLNFYDAEPGYYGLSTYLGKKKTIAVGAAFDTQNDVANDLATGTTVDYTMFTGDIFADLPMGTGALTLEAAYLDLDLEGATQFDFDNNGTTSVDANQSQGNGYYIQAGYYTGNWQPWIEFEDWDADASNNKGSYDSTRLGVTYFIEGHNANIKAGYESFQADANIGATSEDTIKTYVVGFYVTY